MSKTLKSVRKSFLNYFSNKKHKVVDSSNLVPSNDPTLMFTNSGMVQFKNVFTGLEKRDYSRAVTSQKCVRAGGKHNDLENVGYTPRHHTFFEMLGNFSFGDYFKDVAIELAWNLITKEFKIPKEKLSVSVYSEDKEAFDLWKKIAGLPESRIYKISTNDNFWSMGDIGPCGPCSEIFYDHGNHLKGGPPGSKDQDGDRFIEIWNLVFMQFEQVSKDKRISLPKPSVDTGMGLERISALLQGTHDNYETDHFKNLIEASSNLTKTKVSKENISSHRVIADHLRASSFLIAEGVLPSNEGRGYVLRRIMRRGMRHSHTLGSKEPIFYKMIPTLIKEMSDSYPELKRAEPLITETLKTEEEKFSSLLNRGIEILNENLNKVKNNSFPGEVAFKLYDTYGFPLDLTADILKNKNIKVDNEGFEKEMEKSKKLARANWKGSGDKAIEEKWFKIREKINPTEFLGYEFDKLEGVILKISKGKDFVNEAKAGDEVEIITNQTPFYAESGGQVADKGYIKGNGIDLVIEDVQFEGDLIIHTCTGTISGNNYNVECEVDIPRRQSTRKNHTATHLMHKALKIVLGDHVQQAGSLVHPDYLRFDLTHFEKISSSEIKKIETIVNNEILSNNKLDVAIQPYDQAKKEGAVAMFGEKYGDEVRVITVADFSKELCGGTHVERTGDIGIFKITEESSLASGIRRIVAVTGPKAVKYIQDSFTILEDIKLRLNCNIEAASDHINKLINDKKELEKKIKQQKKSNTTVDYESIIKQSDHAGNSKIISTMINVGDIDELKDLGNSLLNKIKSGIAVIGSMIKEKPSLVVVVTSDLIKKDVNAGELAKKIGTTMGGGGGGKSNLATAGGKDKKSLELAIKKAKTLLRKSIEVANEL